MSVRYNHIRPCHVIGQRFLAAKADGYACSVDQLHKALIDVGFGEHAGAGNYSDGRPRVSRLSTLIWNLRGDKEHGGCDISTLKVGKTVVGYVLKTPERLNERGQVVAQIHQYVADQKSRGFTLPKRNVQETVMTIEADVDAAEETFLLTDQTVIEVDVEVSLKKMGLVYAA